MKTQRQEALVNSFLAQLGDEVEPVYRDIVMHLSELGYNPQKDGANLSFKHNSHNKQMAKMGMRRGKVPSPFFALRFSACRGYSQRFADIVEAAVAKSPKRVACCVDGGCRFCAGEPDTHIYAYASPDGMRKTHCGAYALEIPGIAPGDIGEIKKLIGEEHEYLLKHEAGR